MSRQSVQRSEQGLLCKAGALLGLPHWRRVTEALLILQFPKKLARGLLQQYKERRTQGLLSETLEVRPATAMVEELESQAGLLDSPDALIDAGRVEER